LTIFQAIPAPYVYAVSRGALVGITAIFSRISSYNIYNCIPILPHSVSSSFSSSKIIEEVEKVEVINKVVEEGIPVLTNQNHLITETLTTQTQGPSLFEAVAAPFLEQVQIDVQENLIKTVGAKLDKLEHVTSTSSSVGAIAESVLEVGTGAVGATAGIFSLGILKELQDKEFTMKKEHAAKVVENIAKPEGQQEVLKVFEGPTLDTDSSFAALTGVVLLGFCVVVLVAVVIYKSYENRKLEKAQNLLVDKYNRQNEMLNAELQKMREGWIINKQGLPSK
jgi:hypothetical protein